MKDSSNKLMQRWIGPAKIPAKVSPNSYEVECDDGSVKRLHSNHLRAYHEQVNAVGLVFENDEEFWDLEYVPIKLDEVTETLDEKFGKLNLRHLNSDQRRDVLRILQKNKEVFSDRPGLCDPAIAKHVITVKMKEEDWPKQKKPYQVPPILRPEIERQIQELLRDGMIEPSVSPIARVMKSDKTVRMCCDNRFINSICIPDRQPIRRVDDILDQVGAATYISAFDASSGYWQIGVQEESRPYTAFVFDQAYQLKNAAATYQRAMEKILTPHSKYATAYIDDISVYSMTWKEHLRHMDDVLQTILRSGFKLRLSKCKFAQRQIKLLGQIVGNGTRQLDPEKV